MNDTQKTQLETAVLKFGRKFQNVLNSYDFFKHEDPEDKADIFPPMMQQRITNHLLSC